MASENIFSQYIQPLKSVEDWQAERDQRALRAAQLQGIMQNNALAALTGEQTRRQMADTAADRNALAALAAGWTADTTPDQRVAGLRNSGRAALMNQADALEKQYLDRRNTESQIGERAANANKARAETIGKHLDVLKTLSQAVMANPTPQNAAGALAQWEQMTGQQDPNERAQIAQLQTPEQVMAWARAHALKADDLKAQVFTNNTGGATVTQSYNPVTGKLSTLGQVRNTQSPDNAATVAATIRGQNMTDARAREANNLTREANANVYDPERGVLVNKATGLARPAATIDGKPLAAKQPESTKKELASIDAQLSVLDGAIRDVKASPEAFSFGRGLATMAGPLSESVVGRMDSPDARDARSYVFNVVSKVINERAGAAQSKQELARLRSFLPAETDNAQQITDKLESFKGYLSDLGNGYQPGKYQPQQPKAAAGGTDLGGGFRLKN